MQRRVGGTDAASSTSLSKCPQGGATHLLLRLDFGLCQNPSSGRRPLQVPVLLRNRRLSARHLLVFGILGVRSLAGSP